MFDLNNIQKTRKCLVISGLYNITSIYSPIWSQVRSGQNIIWTLCTVRLKA